MGGGKGKERKTEEGRGQAPKYFGLRAALSIWRALRTSPCRGPNSSVDRRARWMRRAPGWQGAPDGQQAKN